VLLKDQLFAAHYTTLPGVKRVGEKRSAILGTRFMHLRPEAPGGLSGSYHGNKVHLRWNEVKRAKYYLVYRNDEVVSEEDVSKEGKKIASIRSNHYRDEDIQPGQSYQYTITAVAGSGQVLPDTGAESLSSTVITVYIPQ
jgi:hypothetical protein